MSQLFLTGIDEHQFEDVVKKIKLIYRRESQRTKHGETCAASSHGFSAKLCPHCLDCP